jgi:hypothetical protein
VGGFAGVRTRETSLSTPWPTQMEGGSRAFVAPRTVSAPKSPTLFFHSPPLSAQFPPTSPTLSFLPPLTHGTTGDHVGDGAACGGAGGSSASVMRPPGSPAATSPPSAAPSPTSMTPTPGWATMMEEESPARPAWPTRSP